MMLLRAVCLIGGAIIVVQKPPLWGLWASLCVAGMVLLPLFAVILANDRPPRKRQPVPPPGPAAPPTQPGLPAAPDHRSSTRTDQPTKQSSQRYGRSSTELAYRCGTELYGRRQRRRCPVAPRARPAGGRRRNASPAPVGSVTRRRYGALGHDGAGRRTRWLRPGLA